MLHGILRNGLHLLLAFDTQLLFYLNHYCQSICHLAQVDLQGSLLNLVVDGIQSLVGITHLILIELLKVLQPIESLIPLSRSLQELTLKLEELFCCLM